MTSPKRARAIALAGGALGASLTVMSLIIPWSFYGDIDISLYRFNGWPVYAASAIALQVVVVSAQFLPGRRAQAAAGFVCAAVAVVSAVALGSRYDNAPEFFDDVMPLMMVMPYPGPGSLAAVLAALANTASLLLQPNRSTLVNMARRLPSTAIQK